MPQASWMGSPSIRGSTDSMRMGLLTFSLVGLQFTWGIEMTYCTPYLLQLGLTKSKVSLVWIAGPLSGLIMQPIVGIIADRSRSKWGRRRPFMVCGSVVVGMCLLVLGWTSEIVGAFVTDAETKRSATIALAVLSIYAVDFAINVVQACCRSLIVDTLPIPQQQLGSAWASRMAAIGHLIGYFIGTIDMVATFGTFLGDTQFKQMTVISALALLMSVSVTCYAVEERVLISARDSDEKSGAIQVLSRIFKTTTSLPPRIQAICWCQFWAWIGWFPFLFYSTTWVGETYFRYDAPPDMHASTTDKLGAIGRIGSVSLVLFSGITFLGSVILPFAVRSPSHDKPAFTPSSIPGLEQILIKMARYKPDLQAAWLLSHLIFASIMVWAPFIRSVHAATTLVAICGIPWSVACWAPFAFMGVEINRLATTSAVTPSMRAGDPSSYTHVDSDMDEGYNSDIELSTRNPNNNSNHTEPSSSRRSSTSSTRSMLHLNHRPSPHGAPATGELAGIYLGVLNVYTTLPQFLGTFIAWIVFMIMEPGREMGEGGDSLESVDREHGGLDLKGQHNETNPIAVCLFIGALSALAAAEATRRFRKMGIMG